MKRANYIFELHGCPSDLLKDENFIEGMLSLPGYKSFNKILMYNHIFGGITIIGGSGESSIAIHTWPDDGHACVSIITDDEKLVDGRYLQLKNIFKATSGLSDKWLF